MNIGPTRRGLVVWALPAKFLVERSNPAKLQSGSFLKQPFTWFVDLQPFGIKVAYGYRQIQCLAFVLGYMNLKDTQVPRWKYVYK
jgi:hypothetical protein